MWQTLVSRRELIELILTGQQKFLTKAIKADMFAFLPKERRSILVCWKEDPNSTTTMPAALVLYDDEREDFFAAINSSSSAINPLSTFCRVITSSEARLYSQAFVGENPSDVLEALTGLVYGETMLHANGFIRSIDLSPAMCRRTIAYAWAKALAHKVPREQLDCLIDSWFDALSFSSGGEKLEQMRRTISAESSILRIATNIYYGVVDPSPMGELCQALIRGDEKLLDRYWKSLSANLPEQISLSEIAKSNREERSAYFQSVLKYLTDGDSASDLTAGICAFLATRISPGSFEHLDVLTTRNDPRLSLWYSFLAALQKPKGILGFSGGLGSRLLRDINVHESFKEAPVCDIALSELRVLARSGLESISKRLAHSNEIEIEIIPLVTCSFRFQTRTNKQSDFFEAAPVASSSIASKEPTEDLSARIENILKSLEEVAETVRKQGKQSEPKRSRRKI